MPDPETMDSMRRDAAADAPAGTPADTPGGGRRCVVAGVLLALALALLGALRPAGGADEDPAPRVPLHFLGGAAATLVVIGLAATLPRSGAGPVAPEGPQGTSGGDR